MISTFLFVSNRNDNTVAIFDISNSQDPLFVTKFSSVDSLGVLNGPTGGPTGLAITGTTVYVANQFDNNVAIFDIILPGGPILPPNPIRVGDFGVGLISQPTGLAITGNTLYVSNSGDNSLVIYDISLPSNPIPLSKFGGGDLPGVFNDPNGLAITGNILYVSNSGDDTVAIFDISSPGFLSLLGQVNDGNLSGPTGLTTTGTTLYAANFNNSRVDIYDIIVPNDPVHVGEFGAGDLIGPQGLAITDTTLYVANFNNSTVEIYDSIVPNDPIRIRDFGAGVLNGPFGLAVFIPPNPV
ncbi:hypothetical protein QUF86_23450 [Peribacillus sp. NJ11]|nr:hypothetical protein [Peribacillus sp. NJ11]MDM5223628.1 hypothetical protein [Peribacillus sp. NJ11]